MPHNSTRSVLVLGKYYHPAVGGIEQVIQKQAEYLAAQGGRVTVLGFHHLPSRSCEVVEINGVTLVRSKVWMNIAGMPLSFHYLLHCFRQFSRHDSIHLHEPNPWATLSAAFLIRGKRLLITWHSEIVRQRLLRWLVYPFQCLALMRSDQVLVSSGAMVDTLPACVDQQKVAILPYSIVPEEYRQPVHWEMDLPQCYFLFLGRLVYYKGVNVLLEALQQVDFGSATLVIAGDGPLAPEVESMQNQLALRDRLIFINRYISEEEKHALLSRARFLLFPSTHPSEAFGIVQLEAMAYGVPVINTELPTGVPSVSLHDETGLTVDPGSPSALASAINRLLKDEDLRRRLGRAGRHRVEQHFSDQEVLPRFLEYVVGEGSMA